MKKIKEECKVKTAGRIVDHLGRKLYTSTPPAIAELVANSYDAYATQVDITCNNDSFIIADNGFGMSIDDIKNKYLIVGKEKTPVIPPNGMTERYPMGRKGIGKYAAFSIGDSFEIFTKVKESTAWLNFKMEFEQLNLDETEARVEVYEYEELPEKFEFSHETGTIIFIENSKRNITERTLSGIKTQFRRRFYLMEPDCKFIFNNELLNMGRNDYMNELELITVFNQVSVERFRELHDIPQDSKVIIEDVSHLITSDISGWIGTAKTPKVINNENFNFATVAIYKNGKLADEDIFKNDGSARIAASYLLGEVVIDKLDFGSEDPIISSRQGLNTDNTVVKNLITELIKVRSYVIEKWDSVRVKKLPPELLENTPFSEWLNNLQGSKKNQANKLLNSFRVSHDEKENIKLTSEDYLKINNIVQFVEKFDYSSISTDDITNVGDMNNYIMSTYELSTIDYVDAIKKRVGVINLIEKLYEKHALETEFEKVIFDNLWLINEEWYFSEYKKTTQYRLPSPNIETWGKSIMDIVLFDPNSGLPVLIELKRGGGKTKYEHPKKRDILDQCERYRRSLLKELRDQNNFTYKNYDEIEAVFIAQDKELEEDDIMKLNRENIKYISYKEFLAENKKKLSDYYKAIEERNNLPQFDVTLN